MISFRRLSIGFFLVGFIASTLASFITPGLAQAADGDKFQAGRIIDDGVFYNENTMSASQIQSFLNAKVPACDTNGTKSAADWGYPNLTHAQLAKYKREGSHGFSKDTAYHAPPYTCLKNFKQDTPRMSGESGLCGALSAKSDRTSAQIINDISKACGVNPRVLLVTLQKEQSLITDTWPLRRQYTKATGFGCPDSDLGSDVDKNNNNCYDYGEGFFKQVFYAARQFKYYRKNASSYNYIAGRYNRVYWHPNSSCGTSNVFIKNQATAALYIYTPYRPNRAALDNMYGEGNSCSSYGNRNFWRMFTDWFGSTTSNVVFKSMSSPRWMRLEEDTRKIDPFSKEEIGSTLLADRQIYFDQKIVIDGATYLRTAHDTDEYYDRVIPISLLDEINLSYTPLEPQRWMELEKDAYRINPRTNERINKLRAGTWFYGNSKTEIGGTLYVQSQYDTQNNLQTGIPYSAVNSVTPEYSSLESPRWLTAVRKTRVYDLRYPGGSSSPAIEAGSKTFFSKKVTINGRTFVAEDTPSANTYPGTPLEYFNSVASSDILLRPTGHRAFKITENLQKTDLRTNKPVGRTLAAGSIIYIQSYIDLGDERYYRSAFDTEAGNPTAIPRDKLEPVEVSFEPMQSPRKFSLPKNLRKIDPVTHLELDEVLKKGRVLSFDTKAVVDGKNYLRTTTDTHRGHYKVIPLSLLREE